MQNTINRQHVCVSGTHGHCTACPEEDSRNRRLAREARADVARAKSEHGRSKADITALLADSRGLFAVALLWLAPGVATVSVIAPASPDSPLRGRWTLEKDAAREMTRRKGLLPYGVAQGFAASARNRLGDASKVPAGIRRRKRG